MPDWKMHQEVQYRETSWGKSPWRPAKITKVGRKYVTIDIGGQFDKQTGYAKDDRKERIATTEMIAAEEATARVEIYLNGLGISPALTRIKAEDLPKLAEFLQGLGYRGPATP